MSYISMKSSLAFFLSYPMSYISMKSSLAFFPSCPMSYISMKSSLAFFPSYVFFGVKPIASAQSNAVAPLVPPLPSNFFRASFNVTYLQLYPYMSVLMSFQHRLIINTHHPSAYDLILNVLDRYASSSPLQLFPCLI